MLPAQEGPPHPCPDGSQAGHGIGPLWESPSLGAPQPRFVQQNLEHSSGGPSLTGLFLNGLQMGVTTKCDHRSGHKTVSTGPAHTPWWAEVILAAPGPGLAGPHLLCDQLHCSLSELGLLMLQGRGLAVLIAQVLGLRPWFEVVKLGLIVGNSRGLFPTNGLGAGSQATGWTPAGTLQAFWNTDHTPGTILA